MDPERLIGQAKNKIPSLGNKIPKKISARVMFFKSQAFLVEFFLFDLVFGQNK